MPNWQDVVKACQSMARQEVRCFNADSALSSGALSFAGWARGERRLSVISAHVKLISAQVVNELVKTMPARRRRKKGGLP